MLVGGGGGVGARGGQVLVGGRCSWGVGARGG